MKEYILKDKILATVLRGDPNNKGTYYTVAGVAEYLKVDFHYAFYCCELMFDDGIIKMFTLNKSLPDRVIEFTPKGRVFFTQTGGYNKKESSKKVSLIYTKFKIALTAIASLAIISLTYLNYKATDKANDNTAMEDSLKSTINTKNQTIKSLTHQVESLKNESSNKVPLPIQRVKK